MDEAGINLNKDYMPDIFELFANWKKHILLIVFSSLIVATAIVFVLPVKYLATSTAIPANPLMTDKASLFSNDARELYSSLGTDNDLDVIVGTGQLDTIYIAAAKKFNLTSYYEINDTSEAAVLKAAHILKDDTKIQKTAFGELQVRLLFTDKFLAPQVANMLMDQLALIHQHILNRNNKLLFDGIENQITNRIIAKGFVESKFPFNKIDTSLINEANEIEKQIALYKRVLAEYQLAANLERPAFHIVEPARISDKPASPKIAVILISTAIASLLFALWIAVLLDKKKAGK